jgi:hypothetical protein
MLNHKVAETRQFSGLPALHIRTVAYQQMRSTCSCGAVQLGA